MLTIVSFAKDAFRKFRISDKRWHVATNFDVKSRSRRHLADKNTFQDGATGVAIEIVTILKVETYCNKIIIYQVKAWINYARYHNYSL